MKCEWLSDIDTKNLREKTFLIAGGTGFIGTRCVELLEKIGCKITVLTRNLKNNTDNIFYKKADLTDLESLKNLNIDEVFDYAIYMAANIPLAGAKKETYLEAKKTTLDPFVNFCDAFLGKIKSFVYISSIDVMGSYEKPYYTEDDSINNPTPYGLAKFCGEFYTEVMCKNHNIPYTILRFSQVYGPNEPIVRIIPILKNSLLNNKEFNLYTYGDEKRRFLFIDDAVQAILRACIIKEQGIFNIAGKDEVSMQELISIMEEVFDKKLDLHILNKIRGVSNIPSIEKAEKQLGFCPNFSVIKGMKVIREEEE